MLFSKRNLCLIFNNIPIWIANKCSMHPKTIPGENVEHQKHNFQEWLSINCIKFLQIPSSHTHTHIHPPPRFCIWKYESGTLAYRKCQCIKLFKNVYKSDSSIISKDYDYFPDTSFTVQEQMCVCVCELACILL